MAAPGFSTAASTSPIAGSEGGRRPRLCRSCGAYGGWHGSSYCCCQCRDTGGAAHGLWCSQDCPGPGVANCTTAKVSLFTLAARVGPKLEFFRSRGRLLTRATANQHLRWCEDRREVMREERNVKALLRDRYGWPDPDLAGRNYRYDDFVDAPIVCSPESRRSQTLIPSVATQHSTSGSV